MEELGDVMSLSEVNREFYELCSAVLWRNVSLVDHSLPSLRTFIDEILPLHRSEIRTLTTPVTGIEELDLPSAQTVMACTDVTAIRLYSPPSSSTSGVHRERGWSAGTATTADEPVTRIVPERTLQAVQKLAPQLQSLSIFLSPELLAEPTVLTALLRSCTALDHLELVGPTFLYDTAESGVTAANKAEDARAQLSDAISSLPRLSSLRLDVLPGDFLTFPDSFDNIRTLDITLRVPFPSGFSLSSQPLFRSVSNLTLSNLAPSDPLPRFPIALPYLHTLSLVSPYFMDQDLRLFHYSAPPLRHLHLHAPHFEYPERVTSLMTDLLPFSTTLQTLELFDTVVVDEYEEDEVKQELEALAAWCEARTIRFLLPEVEVREPDYGYQGTCGCCCTCCDNGYAESWQDYEEKRVGQGWEEEVWVEDLSGEVDYDLAKGRGEWRRYGMRKDRSRWERKMATK